MAKKLQLKKAMKAASRKGKKRYGAKKARKKGGWAGLATVAAGTVAAVTGVMFLGRPKRAAAAPAPATGK